ncbi:MAG: hypothetical protein RLZZ129_2410 [Verrucomicrobiota bacterium]|jgi:hypothetical protein
MSACSAPSKSDDKQATSPPVKVLENATQGNAHDSRAVTLPSRRTRPAIFSKIHEEAATIGPLSFTSNWREHHQYLQQLIEAVQVQWERILIQSRNYPSRGTTVTVKFRLNNLGQVSEIIDVRSESGNEQAKRNCIKAINESSPFGAWTEDMKAVLGETQELTFTFYYL